MPKIKLMGKKPMVEEPEEIGRLNSAFFGKLVGGNLVLQPEEAMYLVDIRGFECLDEREKKLSFNDIASIFIKENPKLFAFYNAYRDWRDRGLFIKRIKKDMKFKKRIAVDYPSKRVKYPKLNVKAVFYPFDMASVVDDVTNVKDIFADFWFGQLGVYKQHEKGSTLKFDVFETLFLAKHCELNVINIENGKKLSFNTLLKLVSRNYHNIKDLYEVYEDWRLRGFVIKTGYKFGSHFRIYFPGVSPVKKEKWKHSRHVLHVFPKEQRLLISEWARAVRVAHSVRKTFVLGIPGMKRKDYVKDLKLDFVAYHREDGRTLTPTTGDPSYVILSLSEDETMGGAEFATALKKAEEIGLDLLLAVTDRESDVTYYLTRKINLPGSKYEYYEIEWVQP
jgi:tRNA-intron endonuclease